MNTRILTFAAALAALLVALALLEGVGYVTSAMADAFVDLN